MENNGYFKGFWFDQIDIYRKVIEKVISFYKSFIIGTQLQNEKSYIATKFNTLKI